MDESKPGPSRPKKRNLNIRDPSKLNERELEYYLYNSESENSDYAPESDESESEDEIGSSSFYINSKWFSNLIYFLMYF